MNRVKQAMAAFYAGFMKIGSDRDTVECLKSGGNLRCGYRFLQTLVAVVLVGYLENVCVLGAVTMVIGLVVMSVAAMMDGNPQP